MGRQRSPRHATGDHVIPYLRAANVKDGQLLLESLHAMNFTPEEQEKFCLRPGDVLVTEGCGSRNQIGASARWDSQLEGPIAFQNTLIRLRAIDGLSDSRFVYQWARWAYESGAFAAIATGTSIFHLGSKRVAKMPFSPLTLAQQRRVADVLDAVDAVAARTFERSQAILALKSSFLRDAVDRSHPVATKALESLADVQSGVSWKTADELPAEDAAGVGVMGVSNVQRDHVHATGCTWIRRTVQIERRLITPHTILAIRTNGNAERIGNVHLAPAEAVGYTISSFLTAISPHDPNDARYVLSVLQSPRVQAAITAATSGSTGLKNIAVGWIRHVEIPWPEKAQRRLIGETAGALDTAADAYTREERTLRHLRRALSTALFSGAESIPDSYDALLRTISDEVVPVPLAV